MEFVRKEFVTLLCKKQQVMDSKVTLSFNTAVISKAKEFAEEKGMSLSRLIEVLLRKATNAGYTSIEELPISEWVSQVSEGDVSYVTKPRSRKAMKEEFFKSKK